MQIGRCELISLDAADVQHRSGSDVVVVIDVIRAFTTAVAAFDLGAAAIHAVETVESAHVLRREVPGSFLMGEVRGRRPHGFDAGNSSLELARHDLTGRTVVQRTSNGTRGLVRFGRSSVLVAAAAVNAQATAHWAQAQRPRSVLLVSTGTTSEDLVCAAYIAEIIEGRSPDGNALADAIRASATEHIGLWSRPRDPAELTDFTADIEACAAVDSSEVVMVARLDGPAVVLSNAR